MILHSDWSEFKEYSKNRRLILLSTKAKRSLWDFNFNLNDTLIMGRETQGVPDYVLDQCDSAVTIPMPGGGRSLNVAISAGIAISEATRKLKSK
jgi:tRNA (cytidine/uridine-2'-O-)-methyltransferase